MFYIIPKILRYSLKINQKSAKKTNLADDYQKNLHSVP